MLTPRQACLFLLTGCWLTAVMPTVLATPLAVQFPAAVAQVAVDTVGPRSAYREIPLASDGNRIGPTPRTVVTQLLQLPEPQAAPEAEHLEVYFLDQRQAVALVTRTGLMDDSVQAIRYRVDLEAQPTSSPTQWKAVWVGQQFQCRTGRGQQDWGLRTCL